MNKIYQKQERLLEKLTQQALTDGLTGLYNHRHFWEQASIEMKRANRYSEPLSCLMIDIDNFKFVNDRYNHQFGDSVLRRIATILKTPLRATDILARYGGDEFSVLLPNTDYQGSQVISKKIIKRVRESNFKVKDSSTTVTISLGVSSYPVDQIMDPSQLVEYADTALYEAKAKGKDQICFFHEMKHIPFN
ncbi:GGDEF domain-containing protein [bacterium]|nr:GGDEF domain-containing protein [bacterium]